MKRVEWTEDSSFTMLGIYTYSMNITWQQSIILFTVPFQTRVLQGCFLWEMGYFFSLWTKHLIKLIVLPCDRPGAQNKKESKFNFKTLQSLWMNASQCYNLDPLSWVIHEYMDSHVYTYLFPWEVLIVDKHIHTQKLILLIL